MKILRYTYRPYELETEHIVLRISVKISHRKMEHCATNCRTLFRRECKRHYTNNNKFKVWNGRKKFINIRLMNDTELDKKP